MSTIRRKFDRDFKMQTVKLITERGMSVSQVARDLDIHENVLRKWKQQYLDDTLHVFPGKGCFKPEEEELRRLKRALTDVKEERDILKKPWPPSHKARNEIDRERCAGYSIYPGVSFCTRYPDSQGPAP